MTNPVFSKLSRRVGAFVVFALGVIYGAGGAWAAADDVAPVSFRRDVAPILVEQCLGCHGPEKAKGKYRLDTFERLTTPGESKAAPVAGGAPDKSEIYRLLTAKDDDDRMPQKADPLPAAQVTLIRRWIEQGAKFDGTDPKAAVAGLVEDKGHAAAPEIYPQPVAITALAFSPDGRELAASGYHEVTLWNPADGKLLGRIGRLAERTTALAYAPDGRSLAVAGGTPGILGEVRLCDVANRKAGKPLDRIADFMLAVRFSPDGAHLAAGGADNAVRLYDVKSGKRKRLIEQHADWVTDLAFGPDGRQIASASRDKSARVFEADTGATVSAFLLHEEPLIGVAWSADGKLVFSAGRDRKVRAWSPADAKPTGEVIGLPAEPLRIVAANGMLFVACADGVVRQYTQDKRTPVRGYPSVGDWPYALAVDEPRHRLAAGTYGGRVHVWDVETGKETTAFTAAPGYKGVAR